MQAMLVSRTAQSRPRSLIGPVKSPPGCAVHRLARSSSRKLYLSSRNRSICERESLESVLLCAQRGEEEEEGRTV